MTDMLIYDFITDVNEECSPRPSPHDTTGWCSVWRRRLGGDPPARSPAPHSEQVVFELMDEERRSAAVSAAAIGRLARSHTSRRARRPTTAGRMPALLFATDMLIYDFIADVNEECSPRPSPRDTTGALCGAADSAAIRRRGRRRHTRSRWCSS